MKAYIHIHTRDVVMLSGILATDTIIEPGVVKINYFNQPEPNTVMVSMTIDQFVYLQDQGVLVNEELLIN